MEPTAGGKKRKRGRRITTPRTTNPKGKERYRKEEKKSKQKGSGRSPCPRGKMEDHASNRDGLKLEEEIRRKQENLQIRRGWIKILV